MASDSLPGWANVRIIDTGYYRGKGGWEELFDYGGIRYHALLWHSVDGKGIQDGLLLLLARACEEDEDMIDDYGDECRRLIWPLIKQDYTSRPEPEKTDLSPSKQVVKIEGRTIDGELQAFSHTRKLDYPTQPIPNTFSDIPTFPHTLVRRLEQLDAEVFKVEYDGQLYCLKTVHTKGGGSGLEREINILQRCHHPNVIAIRGIVVNEHENVEGMLTEFIPDSITLDQVDLTRFSDEQFDLWMSQIQSAIGYLHSNSLVWGDAKPANILKRPDNDLVLVDFAGGATEGWVDWKKINTIDGDMQALDRIKRFLQRKAVDLEDITN